VTHETHQFNSAHPTLGPAAEARRRRILRAADLLFAERAYASVQMDDIAHAAEVAKPTLYRYFESKEQLFLAALEENVADLMQKASAAAGAAETSTAALLDVMCVATERLAGGTGALRALDGTDPGLGLSIRRKLRTTTEALREIVNAIVVQGTARGEFRDVDPSAVAMLVLAAVRMAAVRAPVRKRAATAAAMGTLLLQGLGTGSVDQMTRTSASRQTRST
jgi:AcrR family transcriptional regulator